MHTTIDRPEDITCSESNIGDSVLHSESYHAQTEPIVHPSKARWWHNNAGAATNNKMRKAIVRLIMHFLHTLPKRGGKALKQFGRQLLVLEHDLRFFKVRWWRNNAGVDMPVDSLHFLYQQAHSLTTVAITITAAAALWFFRHTEKGEKLIWVLVAVAATYAGWVLVTIMACAGILGWLPVAMFASLLEFLSALLSIPNGQGWGAQLMGYFLSVST